MGPLDSVSFRQFFGGLAEPTWLSAEIRTRNGTVDKVITKCNKVPCYDNCIRQMKIS